MLGAMSSAACRQARRVPARAVFALGVRRFSLQPAASVSALKVPQMLCFQCEQTSTGKGCTVEGVCSKTPQLAGLQDLVMLHNLRLCQLAHAAGPCGLYKESCEKLVLESMFATLTNVNFDDSRFEHYLRCAASLVSNMEKALEDQNIKLPLKPPGLPGHLPSGRQSLLLAAGPAGLLARSARVGDEDLFGVVEMATYGLKGVAAYLHHVEHLGAAPAAYSNLDRAEVYQELFRIGSYLASAGSNPPAHSDALDIALGECLAVGALNLKVMKMLDAAHCHKFGTPSPTSVSTVPTAGHPAILVSGHDLGVLHSLLCQTKSKDIDVYTHGEMLPAHAYPKLREFKHLRGHFGTHWGNQLHEFRRFPGAILMTSNCLRPPTKKYKDRLWTSGPVGFHDVQRIDGDDFKPLIDKAVTLPPFDQDVSKNMLIGDHQRPTLQIGFGHAAVLSIADKVVGAIKSGQIKNIFVVGGCDGTESKRSYFTDLVHKTPSDSLILTMGCGKFRLNSEDHGTVGGLPRLLDMGQCNDAYSAVVVASKIAEALNCSIHDLPLHFAVSWFEQKAVAVLLTLLHLDLKNIRIGPAVPAFLTPRVIGILHERFGLQGTSTDDEDGDLAEMLQGR